MGVLDGDRGIVDQDADGERKAAERHDVERVSEEIERHERREDGERNRDQHDQGRAPGAEEQQDHESGQRRGDGPFAHHAVDRSLHEHRLIEQLIDVEAWRSRRAGHGKGRLDAVHHIERRGVAVLDHRQQHRAQAVLADDVLLHGESVAHLPHVLDQHGRAVLIFDRNSVELADGGGDRVGADGVFLVADFRRASRQRQVLHVDGIHHVERRQPLGQKLGRIEIDHDLPVFSSCRRGEGHAWHRRQLLAQPIDAEVVELLLVQRVRGQADLQHRYARSVELHDDRRLNARRHQRANGVGRRDDLRNGEIEIHVRLEEDPLDGDAVHRLGFHVLDAVDVGADGVLAIGRDALLHLRRGQAGIAPDHRHHRNVDLREGVGRHGANGGNAQEQDERRQHVEGVRKSEREANDAHGSFQDLGTCPVG